ncbi:MAG: hypothetical protein LBO66_08200 [Deltaproteobacteria bacterium]|nr:hypothetical protein [Deltaproteobacteria bacterium]
MALKLKIRAYLFLIVALVFGAALFASGYGGLALIVAAPALAGIITSLWRARVIREGAFIPFGSFLKKLFAREKTL